MNFRRLLCTVIVLLIGVTGCESSFQPPPMSYERWARPGTSPYQVMASLMECGFPSPWTSINDWESTHGTIWRATKVLAEKCMEAQGFTEQFGEGTENRCKYYSSTETRKYFTGEQIEGLERACASSASVPIPSVEKRLNGIFCKKKMYRDYPQCQPYVPPDLKLETRNAPRPEYVPEYPVPNELTQKVQKDNNDQMNKMRQDMQKRK